TAEVPISTLSSGPAIGVAVRPQNSAAARLPRSLQSLPPLIPAATAPLHDKSSGPASAHRFRAASARQAHPASGPASLRIQTAAAQSAAGTANTPDYPSAVRPIPRLRANGEPAPRIPASLAAGASAPHHDTAADDRNVSR